MPQKRKLTYEEATVIRALHATGKRSYRSLGREYGVDAGTIRYIVEYRSYKRP